MNHISDFGPRDGRMGGHHPGVFFLGCLLITAVVVLAVLLYTRRRGQAPVPPAPPTVTVTSNAEAILAERLARGEVSVEDFTAARAALRGESTVARSPAES